MTLDELQTAAVRLSDELECLSVAADDDPSARHAYRVTRACALTLVDELGRLRRMAKTTSPRAGADQAASAAE